MGNKNEHSLYPRITEQIVADALMSVIDEDISKFFNWYKQNRGNFYDGESTEHIVSEWRRETGHKI